MEAVVCHRTGSLPGMPVPKGKQAQKEVEEEAEVVVHRMYAEPGLQPPPSASGADISTPASVHGRVRIRVAAASLNFADVLTVMGQYQERPPVPFIPGAEVSGTVAEVGPGVTHVRVGDPVCAVVGVGGFAEQVVTEESRVFVLPASYAQETTSTSAVDANSAMAARRRSSSASSSSSSGSGGSSGTNSSTRLREAAALPVAFGTAHLALAHRANLQAGEVLLVLGAAGGVGLAAVQIGKLLGARVIAAARGADKARVLRQAGADGVVDTASVSLKDGVRAVLRDFAATRAASAASASTAATTATQPAPGGTAALAAAVLAGLHGVDVVFDPVGGQQLSDSLKVVAWGARVLIIGFASGRIPSLAANIALVKNLTVHGVYWGSYFSHKPEVLRASMQQLLRWHEEGRLTVHISHYFKLSQVMQAFSVLLQRRAVGKVLLLPQAADSAATMQGAPTAPSRL